MSDPNAAATVAVIRRLRWWDLPQVVELERRLFADDPWSEEAFWGELAEVPATRSALALDVDGVLRGYVILRCVGAEADIQTIAVDPAVQGGGLGRRLLRHLLAEASDRGASTVMLEVRADNDAAVALYRSEGFEQLAIRRGYYEHSGADALILRRRLTSEHNEVGEAS